MKVLLTQVEQIEPRLNFSGVVTHFDQSIFYDIDLKEPCELGKTISFLVRNPEEQLPRIEELREYIRNC